MLIRELLVEAAYDPLVDAIRRQFPDQEKMINDHVQWAKQSLKHPDRVTWYLRILRAYIEREVDPTKNSEFTKLMGKYNFQSMEQLGADITHFYGYNYAPIENYRFGKNSVEGVIGDLTKFENEWKSKQETEKGVEPQEGDYKLLEFSGGYAWWFVNRAYCSEEGRSGKHCGNVVGKDQPDQRILSFRNNKNQVLLTFILEPNGTLGEMKAKNNQKPSEKYHPYIVKLLELPQIKGIAKNAGHYAPHMNFNMFDLSEEQLNYFLKTKPALITTQLATSPVDILRAPESIKNNPRLQKIAVQSRPGLRALLGSEISNKTWEQAVSEDPELIIHAPHSIDNFEKKLLNVMSKNTGRRLLGAPASISQNIELLKKIINVGDSTTIGGISPNIKGYSELCELAVTQDGRALEYVPKEIRSERICLAAVTQDGRALEYVPKELRTEKMCIAAVTQNGSALGYVPKEIRSERICLAAVTQDGRALGYVPKELRTEKMCIAAVTQNGSALGYVPKELQTTIRRKLGL